MSSIVVLRELTARGRHDLVGKKVNVTLVEGPAVQGWVYAVDPEQHTLVLLVGVDDTQVTPVVVFEHGITQLARVEEEGGERTLDVEMAMNAWRCRTRGTQGGEDDVPLSLDVRRETVRQLLTQQRIPFEFEEREETFTILGQLTIHPPYQAMSCRSTNPTMLTRIQTLLTEHHL